MRGVPEAFGAAVVDLFSCALIVMLVLWLTSMGTGTVINPPAEESFFLSLSHPHANNFEVLSDGVPAVLRHCAASPLSRLTDGSGSASAYQCPSPSNSSGMAYVSARQWTGAITIIATTTHSCTDPNHRIEPILLRPDGTYEKVTSPYAKQLGSAASVRLDYAPGGKLTVRYFSSAPSLQP
jgi:hypothetical protein